MADKRSTSGDLVPDPYRFPSGIKCLADEIHSMGMKFGIYESAGYITCQHLPGSLGAIYTKPLLMPEYEEQDAKLFSSWGINTFRDLTY